MIDHCVRSVKWRQNLYCSVPAVRCFYRLIVMAIYIAYNIAMKETNIADFKNRLSEIINQVENGEEIAICRRNVPIVRVVPIKNHQQNKTKLGCGKGTVTFRGDNMTEPFIAESDWEMLQ